MASEARQLLSRVERRESILRAAGVAFAAGGFAATSMEDVAVEAGVTRLILYRHFDSKEQLYRDVLEAVVARLRSEFVRELAAEGGRGAPVRSMLTVAREDPDAFKLLMFHAVREPQFEELAWGYWEDAIAELDEMVGPLVAEAHLRPWVLRSLWSYVLHSVLIWLDSGDPDSDAGFVDMASDGLAALFLTWTGVDPRAGD